MESTRNSTRQSQSHQKLPIAKNEDVEFSLELADEDDLEAQGRAQQADQRAQS